MAIRVMLLLAPAAALGQTDYSAFGPLADLIGTWEGVRGKTSFPTSSKLIPNTTACYRERQTFTPMFPTANLLPPYVNQSIVSLAYEYEVTTDDGQPFHHETGQWRWIADEHLVIRSLNNQRGQSVLAAGKWSSGAIAVSTTSHIAGTGVLDLNSGTSVVTTAFSSNYHINATTNTLWYSDDTILRIGGQLDYSHTTANCLTRMNAPRPVSGPSCPTYPDIFCPARSAGRSDDVVV